MGTPKSTFRIVDESFKVVTGSPIAVSPSVRRLTPYEVVESAGAEGALKADQSIFKLDWNEATIPPSPKAREAIADFITKNGGLNWYPSIGSVDLVDSLAEYTGIPTDNILVTAGSDAALQLICATYLDHNEEVVVPVPTYNHFVVFAQSQGVRLTTVQAADPFKSDVEGIMSAMSPQTRLLYLVSPNNPTGVIYTQDEIERLCISFPNTLVVVDEAYFEFANKTVIDLVERHQNLIVTRTFSKGFGLAGLRVGYLAAHESVVEGLARLHNPKSVNTLAQIGAMAALSDLDYLENYRSEVNDSKKLLRRFFAMRGIETYMTEANYIVVRIPQTAEVLERLAQANVYVRDRSTYPGLSDCVRMSVGDVEQTRRLIQQLKRIL